MRWENPFKFLPQTPLPTPTPTPFHCLLLNVLFEKQVVAFAGHRGLDTRGSSHHSLLFHDFILAQTPQAKQLHP